MRNKFLDRTDDVPSLVRFCVYALITSVAIGTVQCAIAQTRDHSTEMKWQANKGMVLVLIGEDREQRNTKQLQEDETLLKAVNALINVGIDPPDAHDTHPGVLDALDLHEAALLALQSLWNPTPKPQAEFANYIADRAADADFADALTVLMRSDYQLNQWTEDFSRQSARLRTAIKDQDAVMARDFTPEEKSRLLAINDLPGKYRRLRQIASAMLNALQMSSGQQHWDVLQQFLKTDIDKQSAKASAEVTDNASAGSSVRDAYWTAVPMSATANQIHAQMEKLLDEQKNKRRGLFKAAFAAYQTPGNLLRTQVFDEYMEVRRRYLHAVVEACSTPGLGNQALSSLDGLYGLSGAVQTAIELRIGGVRVLAAQALEGIVSSYIAGLDWGGGYPSSPLFDTAAQAITMQHLERYEDSLVHNAESHPSLWAARGITAQGIYDWDAAGWTSWKWIDAEERRMLYAQNRLVDFNGYTWLLPPGATAGEIRNASDLISDSAQLLVLGISSTMVMPSELRDHWTKYLHDIQDQNNFPNWSAPPYNLYVKNHTH